MLLLQALIVRRTSRVRSLGWEWRVDAEFCIRHRAAFSRLYDAVSAQSGLKTPQRAIFRRFGTIE